MATHVTWAIQNRYSKIYIQGVMPFLADVTLKRSLALRFLTLEAARDERMGWKDPEARKSLRILRITTRSA